MVVKTPLYRYPRGTRGVTPLELAMVFVLSIAVGISVCRSRDRAECRCENAPPLGR